MVSFIKISLRNNCCYIDSHILSIVSLILVSSFLIIVNQSSLRSFALNNINTDCLEYNSKINVITLYCDSTIPEVQTMIDNKNILQKEDGKRGVWVLNSSLNIDKKATLIINSKDGLKWLKIISPTGLFNERENITNNIEAEQIRKIKDEKKTSIPVTPNNIKVFGKLEIDDVKITSWDPLTDYYTIQIIDGKISRPYIMVNGKADALTISNSEIAYLGYNSSRSQGLSIYGSEGSIIRDSKIHNLWYGFYSNHTSNMLIENNTVYDNIKYGIDPHSSSYNMTIRKNLIINNSAGLVCSHLCLNILFENNQIHNNKKIGILFSKNVSDSIIRYNNITESDIGIGISKSHNNRIYENIVTNSIYGLKLYKFSFNNIINNNTMINSINCDIAVTTNVGNNTIKFNHTTNSKNAICLTKDALYLFSKDFNGKMDIVFEKNIIQQ